jgi:pSer/pThr/pTyr-binding forkhead associated (FHA) protein
MKAKLICENGDALKQEIILGKLPVIVGRSVNVDVHLDDHRVSRHHCLIDGIEGMLVVRDLASRNGTFVNGLGITEASMVPGDKLTIGNTSFVVDFQCSTTKSPMSMDDETTNAAQRRLMQPKTQSSCAPGTWLFVSSGKEDGYADSLTRPGYGNPHRAS